jgi:hypothetical protein
MDLYSFPSYLMKWPHGTCLFGPFVKRIKYERRKFGMTTSKSIGLVLKSPVSRGL